MREVVLVFDPSCGHEHRAEVSLVHGWPETHWLDHCDFESRRADMLDRIGEDGGKALALVLDAGDWGKVEEVLAVVLELNDPKPEEGAAES